ncbi:MAG: SUMF1/EgtB/PvdO family nonheme iron enzyme [Chloroflexota bacterium]
MLLSSDKTNFPIIVVEQAEVEFHLLPITKTQFEQFLSETLADFSQGYQMMCDLNPPFDDESLDIEQRERLFVTGILPDEAIAFAEWLGEGFDLPTVKEWRLIYNVLNRTPPPRRDLAAELVEGGIAGTILGHFSKELTIQSMLDFTLMKDGLVEWVWQDKQPVGLGRPRAQFHPNLWNPMVNEIKPIRANERVPYFGFRLVRRGDWYLKDRQNARFVF